MSKCMRAVLGFELGVAGHVARAESGLQRGSCDNSGRVRALFPAPPGVRASRVSGGFSLIPYHGAVPFGVVSQSGVGTWDSNQTPTHYALGSSVNVHLLRLPHAQYFCMGCSKCPHQNVKVATLCPNTSSAVSVLCTYGQVPVSALSRAGRVGDSGGAEFLPETPPSTRRLSGSLTLPFQPREGSECPTTHCGGQY